MSEEDGIRLDQLAARPRDERGAQCPPANELASLAAGQLSERRRAELLDHVCLCDSCGALLRGIAEDFAPLEKTEAAAVARLRTSSPEWQSGFARELSTRRPARQWPRMTWTFLARAAAILLCTTSAWVGYQQWTDRRPARLLAQAYTHERPFDLRIAQADYAPVRAAKGPGGSAFQRPAELLEAEAQIQAHLRDGAAEAKWHALRAQAEMLGHNPEAAIESYTRALEQEPDNPEFLAGLGAAHALHADETNRAVDYGKAIEYLSRSLQARPGAAEARFNRAIVYERMLLVEEAIAEWTAYLAEAPSGGWADEARRRLAELQSKKNSAPRQ